MLLAAFVSLVLVSRPADGERWIPARTSAIEGLAASHTIAAAGPWVAFVRELPLPERYRPHHAPRRPWELARVGPGEVAEVAASQPARISGQFTSTFVAVAVDGSLSATWRHGHRVLLAPPGSPATELVVHDEADLEAVALAPERLVLVHRVTRALTSRAFDVSGVGEPIALGPYLPRRAGEVVFGAPWLAWLDESGDVDAVHVGTGERRSIALGATADLCLDGVWGPTLFAHAASLPGGPRAYAIDLAAGVAHTLAAPAAPVVCTPEGVFGDGWLWDPVDGSLERVEAVDPSVGAVWRAAPGILWVQDLRRERCRVTDLGVAPVALPAGRAVEALPELVPRESDPADDAARRVWRRSRTRAGTE